MTQRYAIMLCETSDDSAKHLLQCRYFCRNVNQTILQPFRTADKKIYGFYERTTVRPRNDNQSVVNLGDISVNFN